MAIPHEGICARIEKHVKQLEHMAHKPDQRDLAIKLVGHIEEGVACAGIGNSWHSRVQSALKMVCAPIPKPPAATADALDALGAPPEPAPLLPGGKGKGKIAPPIIPDEQNKDAVEVKTIPDIITPIVE